MSDAIITVCNLGKKYRIQHQAERARYTTLRDVLANKVKGIFQSRKTENAKLKSMEDFWALKDVSFEVKRGEVVGIIGRNGAGKSTLLKILSRITEPTTGRIRIRGRVASLLEVGTGFHGELTGRENVFLNGAILGMQRAEIKRKFDEIVAFAEVEKFLDTPVKRYSSGMYVRLAFAVAAHLEPEILIVDEVLAVGDAEFQKKCLGKMKDVAGNGRTVLFVSHNMAAIKSLCQKAIWIDSARLKLSGSTQDLVDAYLLSATGDGNVVSNLEHVNRPSWCGDGIRITQICINDNRPVRHGDAFCIRIDFKCIHETSDVSFGIGFSTSEGARVLSFDSDFQNQRIPTVNPGQWNCTMEIRRLDLQPATYSLDVGSRSGDQFSLDYLPGVLRIDVLPGPNTPSHIMRSEGGVRINSTWNFFLQL
jgi:lipopolysaccharide transport system ATP-binding protein